MTEDFPMTAKREWKLYWPLVLATVVGCSFHGVATYSTGLFIEPLSQEFGWSRAEVSGGLSIAAFLGIPLSPLVGALIDRWGTRQLAIPGIILTALSIASFSLADGSIILWFGLWTIYAVISLGIKSTIWTAAVSGMFSASRGLALAVALSGIAVAQILAPPITQWLIEAHGWRSAYIYLGLGWGAPALILCLVFLYDVHDKRKQAIRSGDTTAAPVLHGLSIREAITNLPLLRVGTATLIMMILTIGVIVHQVPILTEAGLSRQTAAYLASLAGVAGIVGKLTTGFLMDRLTASWVGALTMAVAALAFVLLLEPFRELPLMVASMVIIGYSSGSKLQICAYLTSRYGGMRNFGKIFGVMSSLVTLGAGAGPAVAGGVHDVFGSYMPLIIAGIPASLISGLLLVRLGAYPEWEPVDTQSRVRTTA